MKKAQAIVFVLVLALLQVGGAMAQPRAQERGPLATRCIDQVAALKAEARAVMKAGDPDRAQQMMFQCRALATDPEVLAIEREALIAARAKDERLRKIEKAKRDKADKAELAQRKREGVVLGMTREEVLKSSWGKPRKINSTHSARGTDEQWVYPGGYLYFTDGVLRTVQN